MFSLLNFVPQALVLFRKMRKLGIKRSLLTYNAALGAVAHAGRWRASLHLLDEMKEADGLKPTRVTIYESMPSHDHTAMPPKADRIVFHVAMPYSVCTRALAI